MHPAIFNRARVYGAKLIRDLPRCEDIYLGVASSTHAMAIAGLDSAKPDSDPIKYRVVNSWGPDMGDHGIYHMYAEWFEENVFKLAIHESVLDERDRAGVRRMRSRCPAATSTESGAPAGLLVPGRAPDRDRGYRLFTVFFVASFLFAVFFLAGRGGAERSTLGLDAHHIG